MNSFDCGQKVGLVLVILIRHSKLRDLLTMGSNVLCQGSESCVPYFEVPIGRLCDFSKFEMRDTRQIFQDWNTLLVLSKVVTLGTVA